MRESDDWQEQAACRDMGIDQFFHPEHERGPARQRRAEEAIAVCERCPVRAQCLARALRRNEVYGIWGGLTEEERMSLTGSRRQRLAIAQ